MKRRGLNVAMTVREAEAIAGTLGKTSKMPGPSYGISAKLCITGAKMRGIPGSVCSACYAFNDFYATWTPVAKGHARRYDGLTHPRWEDALVTLINAACKPDETGFAYFRWLDSGDLQSPEMLERIIRVCLRTPHVKHWFPTREYAFVHEVVAVRGVAIPSNLVIRLSAMMIDTEPVLPPEVEALGLPTSTVHTCAGWPVLSPRERKGAVECLAVAKRDNICGDCRACWEPRVSNVSYPQH